MHNLQKTLITAFSIALFCQLTLAQPAGFNYDEAKVPEYILPDLLKFADGSIVETPKDWTEKRRPEIFQLFEKNVFGKTPLEAPTGRFVETKKITDFMDGKATLREVSFLFENNENVSPLNLLIITPNQAQGKVPAFVGLNFRGNQTVHSSSQISISSSWVENDNSGMFQHNLATEKSRGCNSGRWPIDLIIEKGYALITCYYGDIDPDYDDQFQNGIFQQFNNERNAESWGSLAAWAWGLSKMYDYAASLPQIDDKKVAVIGHSRLGKAALWAGAIDQRFAMVISNNSGCGGAALSRREFGETVQRITTVFPHWFCSNFAEYGDKVNALPIDQHMLIALMAPRPVYIASAQDDEWADPKGEFLSGKHADEVYRFLGTDGLPTQEMPEVNEPTQGTIGYHIRTGEHDLTRYDWQQYLNFADKHFANIPSIKN